MSERGLEPLRDCSHQPLKLARLPIPPLRRGLPIAGKQAGDYRLPEVPVESPASDRAHLASSSSVEVAGAATDQRFSGDDDAAGPELFRGDVLTMATIGPL